MRNTRRNDYYMRLETCPQCEAPRGSRCRNEDGSERLYIHGVRVMRSESVHSKSTSKYGVECTTCNAEIGSPCRSRTYGSRLSTIHAPRQRALTEKEEQQ